MVPSHARKYAINMLQRNVYILVQVMSLFIIFIVLCIILMQFLSIYETSQNIVFFTSEKCYIEVYTEYLCL